MDELKIRVGDEQVSGLLLRPANAKALYLFAHGAGAGMTHRSMDSNARGLAERGIATLRYQFPYMEKGSKRPDPPRVAHAAVRAAAAEAVRLAPDLPLYRRRPVIRRAHDFSGAGGGAHSRREGAHLSRLSAASGGESQASIAPSISRKCNIPMLFVSGDRDALAELELLKPVVAGLGQRATLHVVRGADHGFKVAAKSGRTNADSEAEALDAVADWISRGAATSPATD